MTREPSTQPITTKLPLFSACKSDIFCNKENFVKLLLHASEHILTSLNIAIIFCDDTARTTTSGNGQLLSMDSARIRTDTRRLSHYLLRDHSSSKVYPCISFRSPYMYFHRDLAKAFPWLLNRCVEIQSHNMKTVLFAGYRYLRGTAV